MANSTNNIGSAGDISTLTAADPIAFDDGRFFGQLFWDNHLFTAFNDFYNFNYDVPMIETNDELQAFLFGANGDAYVHGTNLLLANGIIDTIDFTGDGGSFSFRGSMAYSVGDIGTTWIDSLSGFDGTDGILLEGHMRINSFFGVIGEVTRLVSYSNNMQIEYIGKFQASRSQGYYNTITATDAGGSFSLSGVYQVAAYQRASDAAFTLDDILNTAYLFNLSDTFTVIDGTREWHGFAGNDKMYGGAVSDTLYGDTGNDTLDGGAGDDFLAGGLGNDVYFVDSGADSVIELASQGVDTVNSSVSFNLSLQGLNIEKLVLTGGGNIDATGNDLRNTLTGNTGDNTLDGGIGADRLIGGAGNDTYVVDNAGDSISDSAGIDTVHASVSYTLVAGLENLELSGAAIRGTGNVSANIITGNANANILNGVGGNDTLDGGMGNDTLTGGAGADIFTFTATDGVSDTVTDFNRVQGDKIDISNLLTGFDPMADDITQFVRIDTVGTGSVLFVDADGGGDNFIQIATLNRATGLNDELALLNAGVLIAS